MSLSSEYKRQFGWRAWPGIFAALPPVRGQIVLDMGCGVGDQAAELVARSARVIGVDMSEELLQTARSRHLANAEFRLADLRTFADFGIAADGLWCSFTAAYFPDLPTTLASWMDCVRNGGWVALTEIDDLRENIPLMRDVAHRTSAMKHADRIVLFDHGRLVEPGRFQELVQRG